MHVIVQAFQQIVLEYLHSKMYRVVSKHSQLNVISCSLIECMIHGMLR